MRSAVSIGASVSIVISILLLSGCQSTSSGLHNSTKRFTSDRDMLLEYTWDPIQIERTWQAALVRIPDSSGSILKTRMSELEQNPVSNSGAHPTVVYMHGCAGIWPGTIRRINFLAKNGFAVIAPASFARTKYPQSCDTSSHKGGMYRGILRMRQYDAGNAIEKARALPWVDSDNIFLMGLSQGGITAATFRSRDKSKRVNARVIEGWTCHAGWSEYRGIRAPESEPVLSLVGENDPWFRASYSWGDCGGYMNKTNGSRSVVFSDLTLRSRHELMEFKSVQKITLEFLRSHIR